MQLVKSACTEFESEIRKKVPRTQSASLSATEVSKSSPEHDRNRADSQEMLPGLEFSCMANEADNELESVTEMPKDSSAVIESSTPTTTSIQITSTPVQMVQDSDENRTCSKKDCLFKRAECHILKRENRELKEQLKAKNSECRELRRQTKRQTECAKKQRQKVMDMTVSIL